jgi:hypothetical protein
MINQKFVSLTDAEKTKILETFTDWKFMQGSSPYWETKTYWESTMLDVLLTTVKKIIYVGWKPEDLEAVINDISEWRDRCFEYQRVAYSTEADNKILKKKLEQSEALNQAFIRTYLSGQHDNLPELFRKVYEREATPTDMVNLKKLGFCLEDVVTFVRKVEKNSAPPR